MEAKNKIVDEWLETVPGKSARPISVWEATALRKEATTLKSDGEARSKPWSAVLREFLGCYNDYRNIHLRFRDPDGDLVRAPMPNSHQPQYGDTYYARLKGLEREFLDTASNLHIVMLTLTASNRNENDGWRCPADHLRDIIESFTDHVRPALHRALGSNGADVDNWEYARVVEHHKSGYGHVHIALFIDDDVSEKHFQPVIDTHLRHCEPAGANAHNYYSSDLSERPISASQVDAALQPDEYEKAAESIRVYVITDANYSEIDSARKVQQAPLSLGTGDSFQVNDVHANDTVTIVWNSSEGNTTIVDVIQPEAFGGEDDRLQNRTDPHYGPRASAA